MGLESLMVNCTMMMRTANWLVLAAILCAVGVVSGKRHGSHSKHVVQRDVDGGGTYVLGQQGQTCVDVCLGKGMNCSPRIPGTPNDLMSAFEQQGVMCTQNTTAWSSTDQPSYASDPSDPNFGSCMGLTYTLWLCCGPR